MASRKGTKKVKWPIVFSPDYDYKGGALQLLHPFDMHKSSKVFSELVARGLIEPGQEATPNLVTEKELASVHTQEYLGYLQSDYFIADILGNRAAGMFDLWNRVLVPMMYQMGGTAMAVDLSLEYGWAINLGGGFHHASREHGHGFCALADITLAAKKLRRRHKKVLIIDLDAHQGDGHEIDLWADDKVWILDMFNKDVFPLDHEWTEAARSRINIMQALPCWTGEASYLRRLRNALKKASETLDPDAIIYIAGSDILDGDKLGGLMVSEAGLVRRDEMVFEYAFRKKIPITMLFGGGYQKQNARVIADSLENLHDRFLLPVGKPQREESSLPDAKPTIDRWAKAKKALLDDMDLVEALDQVEV